MKWLTKSNSLLVKIVRSLILFYVLLGFYGWFFSEYSIFFPPRPGYSKTADLHLIRHGDNQKLAALYYKNDSAKYTILYSHGNATDLGYLKSLLNNFYNHDYSVLAYDYSGYGLSTGAPSEQQTYKDVIAVYDYAVNQLAIKPERIIAYGHSLGASIATDLASHRPVAALVLESPFVSAFRVRTVYSLYPFDRFSNIKKIPSLTMPIYIMHSRDDPVIAFWHSELLYKSASSLKTHYWLENAGHNSIPYSGDEYWQRLESFVRGFDIP